MSDKPRDTPITREEATAIATEFIRGGQPSFEIVNTAETERSWLFATGGAGGEPVFSTPFVIVDKWTAEPRQAEDLSVVLEFAPDDEPLSRMDRLRRWWARRNY